MADRPATLQPPAYLSKNPPLPTSADTATDENAAQPDPLGLDPTRYGDWERKGIAVDF